MLPRRAGRLRTSRRAMEHPEPKRATIMPTADEWLPCEVIVAGPGDDGTIWIQSRGLSGTHFDTFYKASPNTKQQTLVTVCMPR